VVGSAGVVVSGACAAESIADAARWIKTAGLVPLLAAKALAESASTVTAARIAGASRQTRTARRARALYRGDENVGWTRSRAERSRHSKPGPNGLSSIIGIRLTLI
jgi:hypothetical protein